MSTTTTTTTPQDRNQIQNQEPANNLGTTPDLLPTQPPPTPNPNPNPEKADWKSKYNTLKTKYDDLKTEYECLQDKCNKTVRTYRNLHILELKR